LVSADEVRSLAGGTGEFWTTWRDNLGEVLRNALGRGVSIGIDEARNDPMFRVEKLAKADDVPPIDMPLVEDTGGVAASVSIDWELVNTDAATWASQYSLSLVRDMQVSTLERMRAAINTFITDGQTIPDLTRVFRALINDPNRAKLIAQTESTRSFAEGNTQAWRAQGIEGRRWFSVEDVRVCPVCGSLAGQRAKLGRPFVSKFNNQEIDNPPAHPGCRCYLQPVEIMPE